MAHIIPIIDKILKIEIIKLISASGPLKLKKKMIDTITSTTDIIPDFPPKLFLFKTHPPHRSFLFYHTIFWLH